MINWTEEDVKYICNNMINPAFELVIQLIESYCGCVTENTVKTINKIKYQQAREDAFLRTLIVQHLNLDSQKVNELREEYFKKFDELNKEKKYG